MERRLAIAGGGGDGGGDGGGGVSSGDRCLGLTG